MVGLTADSFLFPFICEFSLERPGVGVTTRWPFLLEPGRYPGFAVVPLV